MVEIWGAIGQSRLYSVAISPCHGRRDLLAVTGHSNSTGPPCARRFSIRSLPPSPSLAGIGPKLEKTLGSSSAGTRRSAPRVVDLLFHLPVGVLDRRLRPKLADAPQRRRW